MSKRGASLVIAGLILGALDGAFAQSTCVAPVHHWALPEPLDVVTQQMASLSSCMESPIDGPVQLGGGQGFHFDGTCEMNTQTLLHLGPSDSISISVWAQLTLPPAGDKMDIYGTEVAMQPEIRLTVHPDGFLQASFRQNSSIHGVAKDLAPPLDGQWHHIVVVRDAAQDRIRLYVDGVLKDDVPDPTNSVSPSRFLGIGYNNTTNNKNKNHFTGGIDDLRVYDGALDPEQIETISDGRRNRVVLGWTIPLQNVTVELTNLFGEVVASAQSDVNGEYSFDAFTAGYYLPRASMSYVEPATGEMVKVANRPDWQKSRIYGSGAPCDQPEIPTIVFPWPVLMQAGFGGGRGTFDSFRDYFESDKTQFFPQEGDRIPAFLTFPMPSISDHVDGYDNDGSSTDDHYENAKKLRDWLDTQVFPRLAQFVSSSQMSDVRYSIVSHSMGSVIARALVTRNISPKISRMVSLDGIHGGTSLASSCLFPGLSELWMNGGHGLLMSVPGWNEKFEDLGGEHNWLLYACSGSLDLLNVVSPDESAWGCGRVLQETLGSPPVTLQYETWVTGHVISVNEAHNALVGALAFTDGIPNNEDVQRQTARYLSWGEPPTSSPFTGCDNMVPSPSSVAQTGSPGYFQRQVTASPGATGSTTMEIDSVDAAAGGHVSLALRGAGASYELRDALGSTVLPANLVSVSFFDDFLLEGFDIGSLPPGSLTIEVTASASAAATLCIELSFPGGRPLLAELDGGVIDAATPVQILANIIDAASESIAVTGTFGAQIVGPDQDVHALTLADDGASGDGPAGDGVFGGLFHDTMLEGQYSVDLTGVLETAPGESITRTNSLLFEVRGTGAQLAGMPSESAVDTDGDGLYDELEISQEIMFSVDGEARLTARLEDGQGTVIDYLQTEVVHTAGAGNPVTATLRVPAYDIVAHGQDGPFFVEDLRLYWTSGGNAPLDTGASYQTAAHLVADFETPPPPTISFVLPGAGPRYGGNLLIVSGPYVGDATRVLVGGQSAAFQRTGQDSLLVTTPPLVVQLPGVGSVLTAPYARPTPGRPTGRRGNPTRVDVVVETPWGSGVATQGYTYE